MMYSTFLFLFQFLIIHQVFSQNLTQQRADVCYANIGCFTNSGVFSVSIARPISVLPQAPEIIDTIYYLYTRENQYYPSTIGFDFDSVYFNPEQSVKIIVHGFIDTAFKTYIQDMKNAFLRAEDTNVILVDWSSGNKFPYSQAAANTQVVGAEIARLVNSMIRRRAVSPESFHIIGHSLGAHIAGYAGGRIPNLGRITGLDPTGPLFENTDIAVRLDKSDAKFVDVIHTDGDSTLKLGLGLFQMSGHVDFYPNGGKIQPNCPTTDGKLLNAIFTFASSFQINNYGDGTVCNHMAAVSYFTDSIESTDCKYIGTPCNSLTDYNNGNCLSCGYRGCNRMGYGSTINYDNGLIYLATQNGQKSPFCQHQLSVTLTSNTLAGQNQARGSFKMSLTGETGTSSQIELDNADVTFKPGSIENRLVALTKYVGENISKVTVSYTKTSNILTSLLYQDQWSFRQIEIFYADSQKNLRFCPTANYIQSGSSVAFNRC